MSYDPSDTIMVGIARDEHSAVPTTAHREDDIIPEIPAIMLRVSAVPFAQRPNSITRCQEIRRVGHQEAVRFEAIDQTLPDRGRLAGIPGAEQEFSPDQRVEVYHSDPGSEKPQRLRTGRVPPQDVDVEVRIKYVPSRGV